LNDPNHLEFSPFKAHLLMAHFNLLIKTFFLIEISNKKNKKVNFFKITLGLNHLTPANLNGGFFE
jgi:hypothetical protein